MTHSTAPSSSNRAFTCAFVGDDSLLIRCAELARERGHRIACVMTAAPAIAQWAQSAGIPLLDGERGTASTLAALLDEAELSLDWLFSVANLRPISPELLALARGGGINFHDGPLPKYGGVHAPAWAIMAGERTHGITWHRMTDRLDAGDIVVQRAVSVDDDETSLTLNLKCFQAGVDSFAELLDALASPELSVRTHVLDAGTYHRRGDRVPAAATLDWTLGSRQLAAIVRALDFGGYRNTLGVAKAKCPASLLIVRSARPAGERASGVPGTVVRADADGIVVATGEGDLLIESLGDLDGTALRMSDAIAAAGLRAGVVLSSLEEDARARLSALDRGASAHERFWIDRLRDLDPLDAPGARASTSPFSSPGGERRWTWQTPVALGPAAFAVAGVDPQLAALGGVCTWLGHVTGRGTFDVALRVEDAVTDDRFLRDWLFDSVPLRVTLDAIDLAGLTDRLAAAVSDVKRRGLPVRDLVARVPELRHERVMLPVAVVLRASSTDAVAAPNCDLAIVVDRAGTVTLGFDADAIDERFVTSFETQLSTLLDSARPGTTLDRLSLLDDDARRRLASEMTGDAIPLDGDATICSLFAAQVARTPDAVAVVGSDRRLSYGELEQESERVAERLRRAGVVADAPVGVFVHRTTDLLVAVLGVLKAGGAYLPLDPEYPADRLQYMITDSEAAVILVSDQLASRVPAGSARVVTLGDAAGTATAKDHATAPRARVRPASLAYLIYTSGSTGAPKGVMVEHRNVVSFFAAMDRVLGTVAKRWLAVTSLSFDISVLELLWPLTHGSTVIVYGERGGATSAPPRVAFGLFYFSADDGADGTEKYRLLLEGARFADRRGFSAVWTPERHFHAFGGLFPNPSVTSAAVAAITERVAIRAGSVVLPLHHPLRIAEEWSVVDNLSNGRVGISFASGWRPDDFVLRPEGFKDAKRRMMEGIEVVRRLWRGEAMTFDGPDGVPMEVAVHPRPVQRELPVWVTAAGSPDTFTAAGTAGAGVLTHLLGQSLEELREKVSLYRVARRAAGHAGPGHVALMLHTFVGESDESVKELVRAPMKAYLRTSVSLIEKNAQAFPTFRKRADGGEPRLDFASLSPDEADALLDYSFERYFETSGLFGTVERAAALTERLASIGVDEVACLIDFGVDSDLVLRHLEFLDLVRSRFQASASASIPELLAAHDVTHLQCTPSQASVLMTDPKARDYFTRLTSMLVGGEAMPPALARSLRELGVPRLLNMYGPTETTIWSTCHDVTAADVAVPIGRPIANTSVRVVGMGGRVVPDGVPGELLIGGPGVTRGYLRRADLTAERFIEDVAELGEGRMYRTGDQVRRNAGGELIFLGRGDHQVKVRGYRIELGEIERALGAHAAVSETAVGVLGDSAVDRRLVGYVTLHSAGAATASGLREALRSSLPEFMIPSQIHILARLPRTPNGKIDRRRLPESIESERRMTAAGPSSTARVAAMRALTPRSRSAAEEESAADMERTITEIWCDVLRVESVAAGDNFFDLGGHSLLAVQVHQRIREATGRELAITDLFRYPTVRALAAHFAGGGRERESAAGRGMDRAALRKQALQRRQPSADR